MKPILLMSFVVALPVFAGTSAKQVIAPPSNPCLMSWFAGASVGYLTELEEPMYNLHVGVTNSCWMLGGWNVSAFAEVGYTQKDYRDVSVDQTGGEFPTTSIEVTNTDVTIMPLTGNVKFERVLTGNLSAYFGAGVGMAWIDVDQDSTTTVGTQTPTTDSQSDSDWVLTTQIFAGLSYSVAPTCEIYGGARWIYLSDASLFEQNIELEDDFLLELGARYKF